MNIREEQAALTDSERLVYAAAFASDCGRRDAPSDTQRAMVAAWVSVLHLRDDTFALSQSVDWESAREMYQSFKRGKPS